MVCRTHLFDTPEAGIRYVSGVDINRNAPELGFVKINDRFRQRIAMRFRAAQFLVCRMLELRIPQVFDPLVSRQLDFVTWRLFRGSIRMFTERFNSSSRFVLEREIRIGCRVIGETGLDCSVMPVTR